MISLSRLQGRVRRLEQTFAPSLPVDLVFVLSYGGCDEPHGRYGYCRACWNSRDGFTRFEPVSEVEELDIMRQCYAEVPAHCKEKGEVFETFEQYLSYHECKCERCQSLARGKELTALLKEREEVLESLTKDMTPEEKAEFEHAAVEEIVKSEDFQKLLRDPSKGEG
jgi:hypothetical protein